jgi:carboxymethylenebutenolidase
MTQIAAADGHSFGCYRAEPATAPLGAVVVVQESFGLTPHIRRLADEFAAQGYVAAAPSLFDRITPNLAFGYDEQGVAEGRKIAEQIAVDDCLADLQATVEAVKDAGKVAIVGYSWGAYLAFVAANQTPGLACAIGYYGEGIVGKPRAKRKIPTLLHFAENDPAIPLEGVQLFRAARPDVSAYTYAAGRGFNCDERPEFDDEAAKSACERTLFWISQFVVGQSPVQLKNAGAYVAQKTEKKKSKKPADDDMGPPLD